MDAKYDARYRGASGGGDADRAQRIRRSVCKIHFHGRAYDFDQPYNKHLTAGASKGTGFVLDAFPREHERTFVVTAYHVVDNASRILCEFADLNGKKIEATLVAYSVHLDVALLRLDAAELGELVPLPSGDSDALQPTDVVLAAGFALGHDYQITSGTVSGRSATQVQVDCAVNGGNSGGPLLDEAHRVVGVVVAGYDPGVAQNINFVAPIVETVQCLTWATTHGATAVPERSLNVTIVPSAEALYRDAALCVNGCPHGGYVTQVHPDSALYAAGLRRRDIVCEIDGHALDLKGKINVGWWGVDRLEAVTLLERKFVGATLDVSYWSSSACKVITKTVQVEENRNVYRTIDPLVTPPEYSVYGGLVVQPLLRNHTQMAHAYRHLFRQPQVRERSLIVITFVRPESPFTSMETVREGDIVTYVNDRPIESIADYVDEWDRWAASDEAYVTLALYDGNVAVATREALRASEEVTRDATGQEPLRLQPVLVD